MALDVLIVAWILSAAYRGTKLGFIRQGFSLIGFVSGLLLASLLIRVLPVFITSEALRLIWVMAVLLIGALAGARLGESVGVPLKKGIEKIKLGKFDAILGAGFAGLTVLIAAWLLASLLGGVSVYDINKHVQGSRILSWADKHIPRSNVIAGLEQLIGPNDFPRVFIGREPLTDGLATAPAEFTEEVTNAVTASTVRINGTGCGGIVSGSGFVAAQNLVVTNAHVIAGIRSPEVTDANGRHAAQVIWFNPKLDIAILVTENLAGSPLKIADTTFPRGTVGAAFGYPGGGPLTIEPSTILSQITAVGRDIYNQGTSRRQIYTLQAQIEQGDSGGPVVNPDGTVIGVIFAASVNSDGVGYAITSTELLKELSQATSRQPVSTGSCVS